MKTTKRSKMLLSSIAMLLVALVALGSATYAWYVVNQSVDANTMNLKASAAEGLVIKKDTADEWDSAITIGNTAASLIPAAIDYNAAFDSVAGFKGAGTSVTDGTKNADLTSETVTNGSYFYVDSFYVGYTGAADKTGVTIKASGTPDAKSYMVWAIYVDGVFKGAVSSKADGSTKKGNTDTAQALTGMTAAGATVGSTVTIKSTELSGQANGSKIDIIGFADGYDTLCKNSTAYTGTKN